MKWRCSICRNFVVEDLLKEISQKGNSHVTWRQLLQKTNTLVWRSEGHLLYMRRDVKTSARVYETCSITGCKWQGFIGTRYKPLIYKVCWWLKIGRLTMLVMAVFYNFYEARDRSCSQHDKWNGNIVCARLARGCQKQSLTHTHGHKHAKKKHTRALSSEPRALLAGIISFKVCRLFRCQYKSREKS